MMTSMSVAYSGSLNPVPHKPNYVTNESLEISFCQRLYGTDQTNCFKIFLSVEHSFSLSSTTHNEYSALPAFRKLHFSIVPGNIFWKFPPCTTRIMPFLHNLLLKFCFVKPCWEKTLLGLLS